MFKCIKYSTDIKMINCIEYGYVLVTVLCLKLFMMTQQCQEGEKEEEWFRQVRYFGKFIFLSMFECLDQRFQYGIANALLDRIESGSFNVFLNCTEYG